MDAIKKYAYIATGLVFVVLLGYLSLVKNQRDNAKTSLDLANKRIEMLQNQIEQTNKQLKIIRQLDSDYQEKLNHAKTENDKLRDSIANGTKRLYVKTNCPASANTATTSSTHATNRAELDREASQRIIRIAQDGDNAIMQLSALQKYVNEVCLKM